MKSFIHALTSHPLFTGRRFLVNLFLFALLLRLIYLAFLKTNPMLTIPILDAEYYLNWARDILTGGPMTSKVFFTEPLYAYLLALFQKISPYYTKWLTILLQIVTGSLLPLIVYKLADKTFNRQTAIASGILTAVYGPFIFYDALLLKTSLETFFLTLLIYILILLINSHHKIYFFFTGLFIGSIASLKGNVTVIIPMYLLFIFVFFRRRIKEKIIFGALLFIGFLIAISPLTIHNYIVSRDFIPTNYSSGMFLYGGSWWDFDGGILPPPFIRPHPRYEEIDHHKMAEAYLKKKLKPSQVASFWTSMAISDIKDDPIRYVKLEAKKILLLITKNELSDNYDYAYYQKTIPLLSLLPDFWLVAALGLTGLLLLLFQKNSTPQTNQNIISISKLAISNQQLFNWFLPPLSLPQTLLLLILGSYSALILLGSVASRYRVPLIPIFIILASYTFIKFYQYLKNKKYKQIGIILLVACALLLVTSKHLDNFDYMTDANFYNNAASYHLDQGNEEKAEFYFLKAKNVDPNYAWAYSNLFDLYFKHGEVNLARENLVKLLELRPDDLSVYYKLKLFRELKDKPPAFISNRLKLEKKKSEKEGQSLYDPDFFEFQRYFKQGDLARARTYLEASARKHNKPENTMLNLATVYKMLDEEEEAKNILETLIRKYPDLIVARYNLANYYIKDKDWKEVEKLLTDVYDFAPEFGQGNALWYLAAAKINQQKTEEATPLVHEFLQKYANDPAKKDQVDKFKSLLVPENP